MRRSKPLPAPFDYYRSTGLPMRPHELEALTSWAKRAWVLQGGRLCRELPGSDNVYRADQLLNQAQELGWLTRDAWNPTREHRFFGLGQVPGDRLSGFFPQEYLWAHTGAWNPWDSPSEASTLYAPV